MKCGSFSAMVHACVRTRPRARMHSCKSKTNIERDIENPLRSVLEVDQQTVNKGWRKLLLRRTGQNVNVTNKSHREYDRKRWMRKHISSCTDTRKSANQMSQLWYLIWGNLRDMSTFLLRIPRLNIQQAVPVCYEMALVFEDKIRNPH